MKTKCTLAVLVGWALGILAALLYAKAYGSDMDRFLVALQQVESSGHANPPDGDGGRTIGPLQIRFDYWLDATSADPSLGGTYQDCRRPQYARRCVLAYLRHYTPTSLEKRNWEVLARTHNGGPGGARSRRTLTYWHRVRKEMQRG